MNQNWTFILLLCILGCDGEKVSEPSQNSPQPQSSDVKFEHIVVDDNGPLDPHTKTAGDLNGDGQVDLVVASSAAGALVWYESPNWLQHVVASSERWSTDAEVFDFDGDGDQDIIISNMGKDFIEWYENPGPDGNPENDAWGRHTIGEPWAHDIETGDPDGDGAVEIVTRGQEAAGDKINIWHRDAEGVLSKAVISNLPAGEGFAVADLDRNGRDDIILSDRWYDLDGSVESGSWREYPLAAGYDYRKCIVKTGDINADGRLDIVVTPSEPAGNIYRTSWLEAPGDPRAGAWIEHIIEDSIETVTHSLDVADLDNDGDLDILTAEMHQGRDPDEIRVYLNSDQGQVFTKKVVAATGSHNMLITDINRDGQMELFGANWEGAFQPVEVWRNEGASGSGNGDP